MSKKDELLKVFKDSVGEWVCGFCNSGSNQPAAIFREIKKEGYSFEEVSPNRWGKNLPCSVCSDVRTHYKLLNEEPQFSSKARIIITPKVRRRILKIFGLRDAFTGATISSTPEIDHKIPWTRLDDDIDASSMTDDEIRKHFQLLTREHNLLKDRACGKCKNSNERPPFFGVHFWYLGNENYHGDCTGCGWHDGEKWRDELNKNLKHGAPLHRKPGYH